MSELLRKEKSSPWVLLRPNVRSPLETPAMTDQAWESWTFVRMAHWATGYDCAEKAGMFRGMLNGLPSIALFRKTLYRGEVTNSSPIPKRPMTTLTVSSYKDCSR